MFLTWFFISTKFLIERDPTWLLLDNSYSKSIWRESLGQWAWPGSDRVGPKSVPGIFTFSEVHGFHFKSQKPWSYGKPDCCKLIPVYYNFWFYKKDNNKPFFELHFWALIRLYIMTAQMEVSHCMFGLLITSSIKQCN